MAREADLGRGSRPPRPAAPRSAGGEAQAGGGTPSGGLWRFVGESIAELKKVEWPNQNQVIQGTVVVLVACVVVGSYLYLNDIIWKHVVAKIIGS